MPQPSATSPWAEQAAAGSCRGAGRREVLLGVPGACRLQALPGYSVAILAGKTPCQCYGERGGTGSMQPLPDGSSATTWWQLCHYAHSYLSPASSVTQLCLALLPQVTVNYFPAATATGCCSLDPHHFLSSPCQSFSLSRQHWARDPAKTYCLMLLPLALLPAHSHTLTMRSLLWPRASVPAGGGTWPTPTYHPQPWIPRPPYPFATGPLHHLTDIIGGG